MLKINFLLLFLFSFVCLSVHANFSNRQPVVVIVYIYDGGAFSDEALKLAVDDFSQVDSESTIKVLKISTRDINKFDTLLTAFIASEMTESMSIQTLMVASHGWVNQKKSRLEHLGHFSSQGVEGRLATLFSKLAPYYDSHLNVFFDSCSIFCGQKKDALDRSLGLYNHFQTLGVETLNVWGARQEIVTRTKNFTSNVKFHEKVQSFASELWFLPLGLTVATFSYSGSLADAFIAYFGTQVTIKTAAAIALFTTGTNGYEIRHTIDDNQIIDRDFYDQRRFQDENACERYLK